jgi:oligopeptide transport system ATP-binding protein
VSGNGPLLEVRDLAVQFKTDEGIVRAVNRIAYELNAGASLGIVGESGSGKSVSSLAVLRLIPRPAGQITSGEVRFDGQDLLQIGADDMRQIRGGRISMIFQDPMNSLNPVLTVGHQIDEAQRLHLGFGKQQARDRTVELLDRVGIPSAAERANDYPHQLSGGMQQRAMIAMAISCEPQLLIADEPTTALDVTIQAQVIELISDLRREFGMAAILITHDLALVAGFCEEIVVMYAGFIVERAPARDVFNDPKHPYTIGLLESMPSISAARGDRLSAIPGSPPDMTNLPAGCPFAPRCRYSKEKCIDEMPPIEMLDENRSIRCWVDVDTGELR